MRTGRPRPDDPAPRRVLDDGAVAPAPRGDAPTAPVSVTHEVLFEAAKTDRCDVCGAAVSHDDDEGYAVAGSAMYLWARGTEVRFEEPPLCPSCAAAIGVSALARWEIEEEEG